MRSAAKISPMARATTEVNLTDYLNLADANAVWRALAVRGLNVDDFETRTSDVRGYGWMLSHKPTGMALHASGSLRDYVYEVYEDDEYEPRRADLLLPRPDGEPVSLEDAGPDEYLDMLKAWADELKAAAAGSRRSGGPAPAGSGAGFYGPNRPFTSAEQAEIADQLRAVRDSVRKNFELTDKQLKAIDKGLEEAEEAGKRLGRKDWRSLFYGVVLGLIVNDAVPPDVAQHIFAGILQGVAHLLGGGPPPLPWMLGR